MGFLDYVASDLDGRNAGEGDLQAQASVECDLGAFEPIAKRFVPSAVRFVVGG